MIQPPSNFPPVAGALSPADQIDLLRALGDDATAAELQALLEDHQDSATLFRSASAFPFGLFALRAWQHTTHAFGYFPLLPDTDEVPPTLAIQDAGALRPDETLKGARIKVTLSHLHIHDYPGAGEHRVLLDFSAQNQVPGGATELLHYNATFRVRAGEAAAVRNFPIFIGLNVGANGVLFQCYTVAVGNSFDDGLLNILESDIFKGGLRLMTTAQPALAPLSALSEGMTRTLADRNRSRANTPVQDIRLGLDFTRAAGGAALAEGSYIALQIAESVKPVWNWSDYIFHTTSGRLVQKADHTVGLPNNYFVFTVTRYQEEG